MSTFLQGLRKQDLSFKELQDMVGPEFTRNTLWITWDELAKYSSVSSLMQKKAVVVLLEIERPYTNNVGHFILLLQYPDHIEHFDSYGLTMEEELAATQEKHLTRIFQDYRQPVINNTKRLQTLRQDINTCGRWVVGRLMLQEMKLDQFLKFIDYFKLNHDDLITAMTMLLQLK